LATRSRRLTYYILEVRTLSLAFSNYNIVVEYTSVFPVCIQEYFYLSMFTFLSIK